MLIFFFYDLGMIKLQKKKKLRTATNQSEYIYQRMSIYLFFICCCLFWLLFQIVSFLIIQSFSIAVSLQNSFSSLSSFDNFTTQPTNNPSLHNHHLTQLSSSSQSSQQHQNQLTQTSNSNALSFRSNDHLIGQLNEASVEPSELIDHTFNQFTDLFFPTDSNQSLHSPSFENQQNYSDTHRNGHGLHDLHSSCETLIGSNEDLTSSIENLTKLTCLRDKRLSSIPETQALSHPVTPSSEQEHSLCFDRSTPQEIGLLSLRSSSDPAIALHTQQQQQQLNENSHSRLTTLDPLLSPGAAGPLSCGSSLPSFEETYSLKYNPPNSIQSDLSSSEIHTNTTESSTTEVLKMDEDCFQQLTTQNNAASHIMNQHNHMHIHQHMHHQVHNQNAGSQMEGTQNSQNNYNYFNSTSSNSLNSSSSSNYDYGAANSGSAGSSAEQTTGFNALGENFYQQYQITQQQNVSLSIYIELSKKK